MLSKRLILLLTIVLSVPVPGQENHFSQFYTSPQYINPAFAGDAHFMKGGIASRIMQPTAGDFIINSLAHFDYKLINQTSGIGATLFNHTETLNHLKLQVNYAHTIRLKETLWVKAGLGLSINQRAAGSRSYLYPDQYDRYGPTGDPTAEPTLQDKVYFPAISAGAVLYNDILWLSISGDYLNRPTENFAGQKTNYPMKVALLAGVLYPLNKTTSKRRFSKFGGLAPYTSIGPIVSLIYQGEYVELSGGLTFNQKPFFGAIHYRYQHDYKFSDTKYAYKAIVLMAGYRQEEFAVTYSYDATLSDYSINRRGAHEISAIMYFSTWKEDYNRLGLVPLPNQLFY